MLRIINSAAQAYRDVIPADRWRDPYMPAHELHDELRVGVRFWGAEGADGLIGVMGIQDMGSVTLIRHAYVLPASQRRGVGSRLLRHLLTLTSRQVLIGTWADALWAIDFYGKHGFQRVSYEEKERLLHTYWDIPERQVETSVVLARPSGQP